MLVFEGWGIPCHTALSSQMNTTELTDDKATLRLVMAWCQKDHRSKKPILKMNEHI